MANKSCKSIISCCIFFLVVYLDRLSHGFVIGRNSLDENRLLPKAKGTIKTIECPEDGVVIDCIDFWKQPAFDDPITKKLHQMKPTRSYSNTFQMTNESQLPILFHKWNKYGECPKGTIPIRRTPSKNSTILHRKHRRISNRADNTPREYAVASYPVGTYNGVSAILNLWNPYVEEEELSIAQMWVVSNYHHPTNLNTIEAGWTVNPVLHDGATDTRFFVYWTSDDYEDTGCYNTHCPGFVVTSTDFSFECNLDTISIYDGDQYEIKIVIERDFETRRWVLHVNNREIGYWPPNIFTTLGDGAEHVEWGGEIKNLWSGDSHTITEMGSGHLPDQGYRRAAYFRSLRVKDAYVFNTANRNLIELHADYSRCYNIELRPPGPETTFFYGGPGGLNCHH